MLGFDLPPFTGPVELRVPGELTLDYVGLDTTLSIAEVLETDLGPRYKAPDLLRKLVAAGFLGMKNGKGFYLWEDGKKIKVNPAVERYRRK